METSQDSLNQRLENRVYEPPLSNFADRIITMARNTTQVQALSPFAFIKSIFAEFHLPQPAYALAAMLVLGVFAGFHSPENTQTASADVETQSEQAYDYESYDDSEAAL